MYLVVGLGNPGLAYRNTRHNAGFRALDALADALGVSVRKKGFSGLYGEGAYNGARVALCKPQTYMNRSGDCVQAIMHFYKLAPESLIVLYDDIELPVGALRIRERGSGGTHNGMRSIIACVGSDSFIRVRIGVGDHREGELADYVLGRPGKAERETLAGAYARAADAVTLILQGRLSDAQGKYNKKHEGAEK